MKEDYGRIRLPSGSLLFAEGDVAENAFLIVAGRLDIFLERDGKEILLASRGAGEIVGEMALIDAKLRSASVRVADQCELMLISAAQIDHRLAESDPILRMCLDVVIARYREMVGMVDGSERRKAPRRISQASDFNAAIEALSIESELRQAIKKHQLELFYQPIVALQSQRLVGFEALLRWNHPKRGLVAPGAFIALAEASGFISEITKFCIEEIGRTFPFLMQAALCNVASVDPLFMSINISGYDLTGQRLVSSLQSMLIRTGIASNSIKLEVTESVLMKDPRRAVTTLKHCRDLGLMIAIDDFGTGYSSLSYLSTLPITTIKIDRSFVQSMGTEAPSRKIILMILRLAEELGIPVIAEGIEDQDRVGMLADYGCAYGQGYLFGKPVPLADTIALVREWHALDIKRSQDIDADSCRLIA